MNTFAFDYVDIHRDQLNKYKSAAEFHSKFKVKGSLFKDFLDATKAKGITSSKFEIENSKSWIKMRLKALIARQEWNDEGFYRAINENDPMMEKALELFYAK